MKKKKPKAARAKSKRIIPVDDMKALAAMPDADIDTSDVPEILDWSKAKRGLFYRPVKQQLTLRVDADVVAWFKAHAQKGHGYQTNINRALRDYVIRHERKRAP